VEHIANPQLLDSAAAQSAVADFYLYARAAE
jgi:hypothetical protein